MSNENEQGAVVTVEGEDGELYSCQILEVFEFEGGEYTLLLRVSDDNLLIMRIVRQDDEMIFQEIESDEEYERVIVCAQEEGFVEEGVINKRVKNFEDLVKISPPIWPGKKLEVQPGDLSLFAPMGIGIEGPLLVRPWDDPLKALSDSPSTYYGYHPGSNHPFHNAPTNEPSGGVIYFDGTPDESNIKAMLKLMIEVKTRLQHYAAFVGKADMPVEERYLVQLRIVSRFALKYMFGAIDDEEYKSFPPQDLSIGDLIWRFILNQQERWGTDMGSWEISGTMGGDGDWAKEQLAFGFMVENEYHGIYRIWSRAWLVTK